MIRAPLALAALIAASPAAAQLRVVPDQPASASTARAGVDVFLINDSDAPVAAREPKRVEVVAGDGSRLALVPAEHAPPSIAARGFARVRYVSAGVIEVGARPGARPALPGEAVAAAPPPASPEIVEALRPAPPPVRSPAPAMATEALPPSSAPPSDIAPVRPFETRTETSNGSASGFLDRFAPYEPTYGVIGAQDSGAKLQFSFALRPFGGDGALSHLNLAYTQTMFWAVNVPSGPFRATTYSPEIFFDYAVAPDLTLALGFRHDSNGEGDPTSIDVNRVYLRGTKSFDLGGGWRAEITPQAWVYVGRRGYTRDVKDYLGYTALRMSIGQDDGFKLAVTGRGNFATGKGAAELFASYPLVRAGGLGLYLFGQAFSGYGEAIHDYRINDTHARIGIALTR